MSLVINTNVSSLNAQRHLQASRNDLETAMERLSSGKRINSAMEDAAGLTIAHSLETKIKSLETAARNANDAISLIHLAEGAMDAVSSMLVRMRELATQALNGTYSATDRGNLNKEFIQLKAEITRISTNTLFNGISVIGNTGSLTFQIGHKATDTVTLATKNMSADQIGATTSGGNTVLASLNVAVLENSNGTTDAAKALDSVDQALSDVDAYRVDMGAVANRLDHSVENLYSRIEQQTAAMSRIQDADFAAETSNLTKAQILSQAATAMLAQANASKQSVLSLLQG